MIWLLKNQPFPPVSQADKEGCLAVTAELSLDRLINAYQNGIFPWYNEGEPVLWWSPNPRMVLFPLELKVSKSMRNIFNQKLFQFTQNQCFEAVIRNCKKAPRKGQKGTWISPDIIEKYTQLHQMGIAKSVEVWQGENLVGGLYGVQVGNIFCGESMFAKVSNASKAGFIWFVQNRPEFTLIDCQVYTQHLASLGAREIPREAFLKYLKNIDS